MRLDAACLEAVLLSAEGNLGSLRTAENQESADQYKHFSIMPAIVKEEQGWTGGQLHHCQERPIYSNKGLLLPVRPKLHLALSDFRNGSFLRVLDYPLASCLLSCLSPGR